MLRRFFVSLLLLAIPVAVFAALVHPDAEAFFERGETGKVILRLLGWLAGFILVELFVLRCIVLPKWTRAIGERFYGGNYSPSDDALVVLAEKVRQTADRSLLRQLERMVLADPKRLRGWRELSDVQQFVFNRPEDALQTLLTAVDVVKDKEDRAMLLYRAAHLAEGTLHRQDEAEQLYRQAAKRFPRTVYGRRAASCLK